MYTIEKYDTETLKKIAQKLELKLPKTREKLIQTILDSFDTFEEENKTKYKKIKQLGSKGKEGITYLVQDKDGKQYAMKTFRKNKSSKNLEKEAEIQIQASKYHICPKVYEYNTDEKYIIMDRLDTHLYDRLRQGHILSEEEQHRIIELYKRLDKAKILHGDVNLMNYMYKKDKLYMIDFGFAKEITPQLCKKMNTENPNMKVMPLGFVMKMKEYNINPESYKIILKYISHEDKKKYKF